MKPAALLLAAGLLLLLAGGAAAQGDAPDAAESPASTYSLSWWSVDGGGASYRFAGGYTLGGTAGQPDAAPERSGSGAYTLRAGFWQPSCVAAAVAPAIARAGSSVTLSWTHNGANQAYQVHRATTPYFMPSDVTRRVIVAAAPWNYTDPDVVIGDPDTNYYYLLRATCGAAYADLSGRQGEFDFRLVPGSQ